MSEDKEDWFSKYQKLTFKQKMVLAKRDWNPVTFSRFQNKIEFTPEYENELKKVVHEKMLYSRKSYRQYRNVFDPIMPTDDKIAEFYGSWTNFRNQVFTQEELHHFRVIKYTTTENVGRKPISDEKIFNIVQFLGITTWTELKRARKAFPDLIPHERTVVKHFGSIKNLRKLLQIRDLKSTIERYIILCINFGAKRLTPYTCRRNGIDIDWAISVVGSKKKFYELVEFSKKMVALLKRHETRVKKSGNKNNENRRSN